MLTTQRSTSGACLDAIAPIMWVQIDDTSGNNLAATWQEAIELGTLSVSVVAPPADPLRWASQGASAVRPPPCWESHIHALPLRQQWLRRGEVRDISLSALFFEEGSANVAEVTGSSEIADTLRVGESG